MLPLLLYPLMGMLVFQVQQFLKEHPSKVRIVGTDALPEQPRLIVDGKLADEVWRCSAGGSSSSCRGRSLAYDELKRQAQHDIRLGCAMRSFIFRQTLPSNWRRFRSEGRKSPKSDNVSFATRRTISRKSPSNGSRRSLSSGMRSLVRQNLEQSNVSAAAANPFEVKHVDVSQPSRRRAALWSKILPFILMIWALTGAFYPAVDLCAGEKERGTLETLLSSPAARGEIVWGKLLTVMTFSMATAILNLVSMTATGTFIVSQIQRMGGGRLPLEVGPPPLAAMVWLLLALVPISALFSALSLAIAAFARSSKEGHYYLLPLLMISLPLMMLSMFPGAELDLGFALIPLSGLLLLLRALMEGQYLEALRFSLPVVGVTAVCCLAGDSLGGRSIQ